MYATVLNALDLNSNSSFLNVGSGSGYLNCLAASVMGVYSVNHGVELSPVAAAHSRKCIDAWLARQHPGVMNHGMEIVTGNAFKVSTCLHRLLLHVLISL